MLSNMKQPAHDWWADALENLSKLEKQGQATEFEVNLYGAKVKIELTDYPGKNDGGSDDA